MNNRNIYIYIFLLIFMAACVTPYYPDITKYENLYVVDGQITNLKGPYEVKLSKTFKYNGSTGSKVTGDPVTGAEVKIIENTGLEVQLKEIKAGVYSTVDTTFRGVLGNSYKIQIKVDDQVFESDFETLKAPASIDKLYWEYKPQDSDGSNRVQVLLDTHDPANSTRYYAWEYEETWKFKVPIQVTDEPDWYICYKSDSSSFLKLGSTIQKNSDIISRQSLKSIDESSNRLYFRYTILAKQYSLTEQTYKYFDDLISLNQNQGSLFDATPYSLVGNVKNVNDKDLPVLGYFVVAGVSEKRIFIDRTELPKEFNPTDGFSDCSTEVVTVPATLTDFRQNNKVDSLMRYGYAIYEKYPTDLIQFGYPVSTPGWELFLAKPYCFNCTLTGVSKVPYFWTEK